MEFEWNILPGSTSLELVREVQKFMSKMGEPEQFQGRFIFMSMFNDIKWRNKDNEKECVTRKSIAEAQRTRGKRSTTRSIDKDFY